MTSLEMPGPAEIDEYIAELTAELAATEAGDPERGRLLDELGLCESAGFAMSGSRAHLDAAVGHPRAALTTRIGHAADLRESRRGAPHPV